MNSHGTCRLNGSPHQGRARMPVSGRNLTRLILIGFYALFLLGCTATNPASVPTSAPTAGPDTESTEASTNSVTQTSSAASLADAPTPHIAASPVTITITEHSMARYLVREQLADLDFPIDAIGQTSQVSGAIAFDSNGQVVSEKSRIVVNLDSLTSDEERRDKFLRTRSLESTDFPTAEFVVREAPGLAWPLPTEGEANFQLVGGMTLHGVTRPLTWDATAQFDNGTLSSQARTNFPFEEFDLEVPRVRILLSVDNNIRLELEFTGSVS